MIRYAIFDLGRVLIRFDFDPAIRKLVQVHHVNPLKIYSLFGNQELARQWDQGEISGEEFYQTARSALGFQLSLTEFRNIWNDIFEENTDMVQFYHKLAEVIPVVVLSNTNPWHEEFLKEKYPWLTQVGHGIITSCAVRKMKPSHEIYELAMQKMAARPEETLYLDDIPEFTESARALGIDAITFKDYTSLMDELKTRDLPLLV